MNVTVSVSNPFIHSHKENKRLTRMMMSSISIPSSAISPCFCSSSGIKQQFLSVAVNDSFRNTKIGCLFNPNQQPILKEAFKEPVAFLGGVFAGILRLDLNEEPLKEWVARTVEASGISEEEISTNDVEEEMPQQIEIE